MCGIAGIVHLHLTHSRVEESILRAVRDAMIHRGPDSAGSWISKDGLVGLAHRRLKIIDLSDAGAQPMSNEDGSLRITFNGEIYNHAALRKELESLGHHYHSHSDTETILHAWEQWGEASLERLQGMFAFAIWDEKKRELRLVRDRMGKKPLYFAEFEGVFLFASEIKSILAHPKAVRAIHEEGLWHYLTFAAAPAPLTLFQKIYKLPPATHLTISLKGAWTFTEYWRPWQPTDSPSRGMDDYATEIRETLQTSVEKRLMSDVPFGVFLSGGVDSSANVAFMSRAMSRPVDTFSVGFANKAQEPHNEIQQARQVSLLFKTNHHEILIHDDHFLEFADQMAWHQDEPLSDPVCFPLYHVSKLARDNGIIVVQVGEGSDEIFAGYEIYRNYLQRERRYWRLFQTLPPWIRQQIHKIGQHLLKPRYAQHLGRAARGEPIFLGAALAFYDAEKRMLRSWKEQTPSAALSLEAYSGQNPSMGLLAAHFPQATCNPLPRIETDPSMLKQMIFWECHQRLGELLLMRLDKMTMATSVEGRAPFLDTHLVELAMRVPSELKIHKGIGKAVLKKALEPILPRELIYRKKIGFCGGSNNMLTPNIARFASENILKILPSFDWPRAPLEDLLRENTRGQNENSFQIWNLMNLALWLKRWHG